MSEELPAILFVDDEENILKSLRRIFFDADVETFTAMSGEEGLRVLQEEHIDLIVSDVRMPDMDGIEFLRRAKENYPDIIRIFLTGYAEEAAVIEALTKGYAQQIISKPWEEDQLKEVIDWMLAQIAAQKKNHTGLLQAIKSFESLPHLPQTYTELRAIKDNDPDIGDIAKIVERDVALSAEVLNWSNSAIFGQMKKVESVQRALVVLGIDMAYGLLVSKILSKEFVYDKQKFPGLDFEELQRHSLACGTIARLLAQGVTKRGSKVPDAAFTAGLLHDIGKLVEMRCLADDFSMILEKATKGKLLLVQAEEEEIQTTHAEIGAYLAERWSLPPDIVETIRFHHTPVLCKIGCEIVPFVYAGNILAQQFALGKSGNPVIAELDSLTISRFDLTEEKMAEIKEQVEEILS